MNRKQRRQQAKGYRATVSGTRNVNRVTLRANRAVLRDHAKRQQTEIFEAERSVKSNPNDDVLHNQLGCLLAQAKRVEEAAESFQSAIEINSSNKHALYNLGDSFTMMRRFSDAVEVYENLRQQIPEDPKALNRLGLALEQLDRRDEAIVCYERAIDADPSDPDSLSNLALANLRADDWRAAIPLYQRALALRPNNPSVLTGLGSALASKGDHLNAREAFEKALSIDSDNIFALNGLAGLFHSNGDMPGAAQLYEKILRVQPDNSDALHFLSAATGGAMDGPPEGYVEGVFDSYAETFDEHLRGTLKYRAPELLIAAIQKVHTAEAASLQVYDLGCGTGLCGPLLRPLATYLVGVDLSSQMIEKARNLGVYDELEVMDIVEALKPERASIDLVVAADVLLYLGDLAPVMRACFRSLTKDGLFAFTTEATSEDRFVLDSSGRYAHSGKYVRSQAERTGFTVETCDNVVLRQEHSRPVQGNLFLLRRPRRAV